MRIYIVGAAGSGKTTLAKRVSNEAKIECFHLDDIFYEDKKGKQRSATERNALFLNIINKSDWIVEDNGSRACFSEAMNLADNILLLYPPSLIRTKRIIFRYIKQKLGLEKSNYEPRLNIIIRMIRGSNRFETGHDGLKERISQLNEKALILSNTNDINEYIESLQHLRA